MDRRLELDLQEGLGSRQLLTHGTYITGGEISSKLSWPFDYIILNTIDLRTFP